MDDKLMFEEMIKKNNILKFGKLNIKENTIVNNAKMLAKIKRLYENEYEVDDEWYLKYENIAKLLDKMEYTVCTKKNYYSLLLGIVLHDNNFNGTTHDINIYINSIKKFNDIKVSNQKNSIISEKKQQQQVSLSFIKDLLSKLQKNEHFDIYTIIMILLQYPIRAEVGTFKYTSLLSYNKSKKNADKGPHYDEGNWLVIGKTKMYMIRNEYKTAPIYGRINISVEGKAKKAILSFVNGKHFEEGNSIFGFTEGDLSRRLIYLSNKYTGVNLSVNALAKITIKNDIEMISKRDVKNNVDAIRAHKNILRYLEVVGSVRGTSANVLEGSYINETDFDSD